MDMILSRIKYYCIWRKMMKNISIDKGHLDVSQEE